MVGTGGVHSRNIGHGIGSIKNGPLGSTRPLYNKAYEEEDFDEDGEDELFVRDEVRKQISDIIFQDDTSAYGLEPQRRDHNSLTTGFRNEGTHTTTARSTIAPFSNRQLYPNGMGPAIGTGGSDSGGQIFRTTGNFRHIGSESGYVDPGTIMYGEPDEPLYDIKDLDDPMERSSKKHQKTIINVLEKINEYLRDN